LLLLLRLPSTAVFSVGREGEGAAKVGHGLTNGNDGDADSLNQEIGMDLLVATIYLSRSIGK